MTMPHGLEVVVYTFDPGVDHAGVDHATGGRFVVPSLVLVPWAVAFKSCTGFAPRSTDPRLITPPSSG